MNNTMIPVIFVLAVIVTGSYGQFLNCEWVNNLDCVGYESTSECGTDGVTYANRCYFAKQACKDDTLHILHDGDCLPSEASTTVGPGSTTPAVPPTPSVDGQQAVLDFFCTQLSHTDCDKNDFTEVCGTDRRTYQNYCEYEKARCTHRDLHVANFGPCGAADS